MNQFSIDSDEAADYHSFLNQLQKIFYLNLKTFTYFR